jgi:hypothetical protein
LPALGNLLKDAEKDFEVSYTRMVAIMGLTYATLFGYMYLIGVRHPALNAVVPSVGFNLSTWSLPMVKVVWLRCTGRESKLMPEEGTGPDPAKHVSAVQ